jgi:hypothetical protein
VPGHEGIAGNETAHLLARTGFERPFTGPELACGISIGVAKTAVRDWTIRNHKNQWEFTTGLKEEKGLITESSARRKKKRTHAHIYYIYIHTYIHRPV